MNRQTVNGEEISSDNQLTQVHLENAAITTLECMCVCVCFSAGTGASLSSSAVSQAPSGAGTAAVVAGTAAVRPPGGMITPNIHQPPPALPPFPATAIQVYMHFSLPSHLPTCFYA